MSGFGRKALWLIPLSGLMLLGGCSRSMQDLDSYVADIKARPGTGIDPIPQMQPYEPFTYARSAERDPFKTFEREAPELLTAEPGTAGGLRPDFTRNREPLEAFPLDGIRMLGTLEIRQTRYALVSAPDGIVHRATYGDHMGQNFGKIVRISDAEVVLEEIVPDGFGGYVKRPAAVAISEE